MVKPNPIADGAMGGRFNPSRGSMGSLQGGAGFNPLAAGAKRYGANQGHAPNVGPVANKLGYAQRDSRLEAEKAALNSRMRSI